jgi:hypothetical protein
MRAVLIGILVLWFGVAAAQTGPPQIYSPDGTYLGNLSSNRFDPDSVSNPFGVPGSPYGSQFSPLSPNNPYTVGSGPTPPTCQHPVRTGMWR